MRIRREDVETVRERSKIEDIVSEHVTLRVAGIGALKGLCPFHDEKTPSFNVRPTVGFYHCFGCDKGGDVISFVMEIDHLSFAEAVERLAQRLGMELRYEDDGNGKGPNREGVNQRRRLLEANRAAAQWFAEQLGTAPDASKGRQFLVDRGFDQAAAEHFGVGFAPRGGEVLTRHLLGRGFTSEELVSAGLSGQGRRGLYDRFRGRLIWPIRDVTGDTLGFGARRLFDDDTIEAKYLNTPETVLYKKSHVLYGVDLAKREIAKSHQVVVVEGYTDVMACHLAGEGTAVATCGTAFAADHIRIVRRLIGDDRNSGGRVIFTFDGDAAGQKAALRAFEDDQKFVSQTYVAIAPSGMDPCDLRQKQGNEAVRELISTRRPMFEFKIRSIMDQVDLTTAEGRVQGLRLAAPVVAAIKDSTLRPEYARELAGWLGMEIEPVKEAVNRAVRSGGSAGPGASGRGQWNKGRQNGTGDAGGPGSQGGPGRPGGPDGQRAGEQGANGGRGDASGPATPGRGFEGGGQGAGWKRNGSGNNGGGYNGGNGGNGWQRGGGRRSDGPPGGIRQPDGSFLLPDGSYHLPPPEPERKWKKGGDRDGVNRNWSRGGGRDGNNSWNNGNNQFGGGQFGGGNGGPGWGYDEPPPEELPPPEDEPPYDAYETEDSGSVEPRRITRPPLVRPDPRDPNAAVERQALECMLQAPRLVPSVETDALPVDAFQWPLYRAIHEAVVGAGGIAVAVGMNPAAWVALVQDYAPDPVVPMITELAVSPLPTLADEVALAKYAAGMILHIAEAQLSREIGNLKTAWQRGEDVGLQVLELEARKRALAERKHGAT